MPNIIRPRVGAVTAQDGTYPEWRGTRKGAGGVQDLGGRYEEAVLRGNVFAVANSAAVALAASGASGGAFTLYNPIGSGKLLSLIDLIVAIGAQTAATQVEAIVLVGGLTTSAPTATTPLTTAPTLVGSGNKSLAQAFSAATFSAAGTIIRALQGIVQAATATTGVPTELLNKDEIAGAIILAPGAWVSVFGLTGGTVADLSVVCSATWEELPYTS